MTSQDKRTRTYDYYKLFSPVRVGPYTIAHRVVLAPMTRLRSEPDDSPSEMMVEFYEQRASKGNLLIVESAAAAVGGRTYLGAPGIYNEAQVPAWRRLTDAVHAKGGYIFLQLFHGGRQAHIELTGGRGPVGASVVPFDGMSFTKDGFVPSSPYRALELAEIPGIIEDYRMAASYALAAGFDGVELHGANGYLPDQFLQDGSNKRTDGYGGTIENRARFILELVDALVSVWGADRVGVRLSPNGKWGGLSDSNPEATFGYLTSRLDRVGLAYLHVIEPRIKGDDTLVEGQAPVAASTLRKTYNGIIIAAGGFDREGAEAILIKGDADLVAFGRLYSSNPDLPLRLKYGYPLTPYKRDAFWGGSAHSYNDFLSYEEQRSKKDMHAVQTNNQITS
jgi:N-ethylmaleimide reductase